MTLDQLPPRRRAEIVAIAWDRLAPEEAKRLRYRIFAGELGARLPTRTPGVDHDLYDPYCDHLVVRDERTAEVVGTYRSFRKPCYEELLDAQIADNVAKKGKGQVADLFKAEDVWTVEG